jgi:SAM-dependent methyltransferase
MQKELYEITAQTEEKHWWYKTRRKLFENYINKFELDRQTASILDLGSESGTNLRLLKKLGFKNYHGFDYNPLSKKFCEERNLGKVVIGDLCNSGLEKNQYDLILAGDILEHIEDDKLAIAEIYKILKPGGKVLVTVPSFMCLWGSHDEMAMHKRRYLMSEIISKLREAGFEILESYYFNFFFFIPVFLLRKMEKIFRKKFYKIEFAVPAAPLNRLFEMIFSLDIFIAKKIKIPFGVSCFLLISKSK